jgi:hypothetical protein
MDPLHSTLALVLVADISLTTSADVHTHRLRPLRLLGLGRTLRSTRLNRRVRHAGKRFGTYGTTNIRLLRISSTLQLAIMSHSLIDYVMKSLRSVAMSANTINAPIADA